MSPRVSVLPIRACCQKPFTLNPQGLPADVAAFIADHIDSVVQLEILLLLQAVPGKNFAAAELAKHLAVDAAWADAQLADLGTRGLLACTSDPQPAYRYAPRTSDIDGAVKGLARAYADRRVSVISAIFSKPSEQIRSFADAFRLRKEGPRG